MRELVEDQLHINGRLGIVVEDNGMILEVLLTLDLWLIAYKSHSNTGVYCPMKLVKLVQMLPLLKF